MFKEKVIIKQIPDEFSETIGLSKYKRSKMPQTVDMLQVAKGNDSRFITGLDEDSYDINLIEDSKEREEKKKEIKALRLALEKQTGYKLDANASNDFWKEYLVALSSDQDLVLNRANPMHVIAYNVLIANGYAAPSFEEAGLPRFKNAKYYAFAQNSEDKKDVSSQKKRDKARSMLLEICDNKDYMVTLGEYLEGSKYTSKQDPDTLYKMLSAYIDGKDPKQLENFVKAVKKPTDELQFKITIDKALKANIIKFSEGYYQRGQVTLGKSIEDVYNNLKSPKFALEFISIKEELES